jgi:hypothetical protein
MTPDYARFSETIWMCGRSRVGHGWIFVLLLAVVVAVTGRSARGDTISALEMRQDCQGVEAATSSRGEITMNIARYPYTLTCFGAFSALTQEIAVLNSGTAESAFLPGVCIFATGYDSVSVKLLVAVFAHFIDEHPEQGGRDFLLVAWNAFKTAGPCTK